MAVAPKKENPSKKMNPIHGFAQGDACFTSRWSFFICHFYSKPSGEIWGDFSIVFILFWAS